MIFNPVLRLSDAFGSAYDLLMECAEECAKADEAVLWLAEPPEG